MGKEASETPNCRPGPLPAHITITSRHVVRAGKYFSGLLLLLFALDEFISDGIEDTISNPERSPLSQWMLSRASYTDEYIGATSFEEHMFAIDDDVPARWLAGASNMTVIENMTGTGSAGHGSSAHGSKSGCWTGGHNPHKLKETLAFIFFCFLICCILDHINLIVPWRLRFPITVVMFFGGMAGGCFFIYQANRKWFKNKGFDILADGFKDTSFFDPHALLYIILPPLLYESASSMKWHTLRKVIPSAALLATAGVCLNTLLTSFYIKGVIRMDGEAPTWEASWLLSSILSATDPVAVVAALSALGAPAKLSSLVEGESLLNDGSAVVLCYVFEDWVMSDDAPDSEKYCKDKPPGFGCVLRQFMHVAVGGACVGLLGAIILYNWIGFARRRQSPVLELCIVLTTVFCTFYCAEALKASGVLAVVALGFLMTQSIAARMSHDARHGHHTLLHQVGYACNQITFFSAGIISARYMWGDTPCSHTGWEVRPWMELFGLYFFITLSRGSVVLAFSPALTRMGYGLNWKEGVIMVYGGLRGAVGLIMGLIVEHNKYIDSKVSQMIAFHTSGIVLLTLFVNGSTVDEVYNRLDMYPTSPYKEHQLRTTLAKIESESQKLGIKVIRKDWFFHDCLFKQLLACVPNFAHIKFDDAKKPMPVGIESVHETLAGLDQFAVVFASKQAAEFDHRTTDAQVEKWNDRMKSGNRHFQELLGSSTEVAYKKDQVHGVTVNGLRELAFHSSDKRELLGMYVSAFSLKTLRGVDDGTGSYGFELHVEADVENLHLIVGLIADGDGVREVRPHLEEQALGNMPNTVGLNCSTGTVNVNTDATAEDEFDIDDFRPLEKGDVLSVEVNRQLGMGWEVVFALPLKNLVLKRIAVGSFPPDELYPSVEMRASCLAGGGVQRTSTTTSLVSGSRFASAASPWSNSMSNKIAGAASSITGGIAGAAGAAVGSVSQAGGKIGNMVSQDNRRGSQQSQDSQAAVAGGDSLPWAERSAEEDMPLPGEQRASFSESLDAGVERHARVSLSFDMHPASDSESVTEMLGVLFNMLLNDYTSKHDHGTLCDDALFLLKQAVGDAVDNSKREVNCKRLGTFLDDTHRQSVSVTLKKQGTMAAMSRVTKASIGSGNGAGMSLESLYEPILLEYCVLREEVSNLSVWDRLPPTWQRLRRRGYHDTRAKVEALWAFVEAHNKVISDSPAIDRFPQLIECIKKVQIEAVHDLIALRDVQPQRYFFTKHLLALRMILESRMSKISKYIGQGLLSKADAEGLEHELWERIVEIHLWRPGAPSTGTSHQTSGKSRAWAWADFEHTTNDPGARGGRMSQIECPDELFAFSKQVTPPAPSAQGSRQTTKDTVPMPHGIGQDKVKSEPPPGGAKRSVSFADASDRQPSIQTVEGAPDGTPGAGGTPAAGAGAQAAAAEDDKQPPFSPNQMVSQEPTK